MKIILADDHALFREGLRYILRELHPDVILLQAGDHSEAAALLSQHPDASLALVDLDMPGGNSESANNDSFERLMDVAPTLPIVVVSACEDALTMRRVLAAGAMGFIPKRECAAVMLGALRLVLAGGVYVPPVLLAAAPCPVGVSGVPPLTSRQMEVLRGLAEGHSNKVIARQLGMTEATVKAHSSAIFRSLSVANRAQAVRVARQLGMLSD